MWKVRVPERVKFFLWLTFHGRLLTNAERYRRKLATSPLCAACSNEVEDLVHIFRECPKAKEVWRGLQARGLRYTAGSASLQEWIYINSLGDHEDPKWQTKFLLTVWYLWKWRCSFCFTESADVPRDKCGLLTKRFQEVIQAQCPDIHSQNSENGGKQEIWVRWKVPEGGWYVLNTDGAAKGNPGRAGAGGVLRGERGEWILGFAENLGVCSSVKAEVRAIL